MKLSLHNFFMLALITLSGLAGSVVFGLMRYGNSVFNVGTVGFAFVAFGLSGGAIFAFYHVRGLSEAISACLTVSVIQMIASLTMITWSTAVLWTFGVNLPVIALAFLFERKLAALKWGKFFVVGLCYGSMFVLLSLVVAAIHGIDPMPPEVFRENFIDGVMIGIGLGAGVQGGEAFMHSYEEHRGVS